MDVEWDQRKADSNLKKHGIDFADAATVLFDDLAITMFDDSVDEQERHVALGMDALGRCLGRGLYVARGGRSIDIGSGRDGIGASSIRR